MVFGLGIALNVAALIVLTVLGAHFVREYRILRKFARDIAVAQGTERALALELTGTIYSDVKHKRDVDFIAVPPLSALGSTPVTVLSEGGCCSGLARLTIVCLKLVGIRSGQITLYHASGNAQHCLVEATLSDGEKLILDPHYGIYYRDSRDQGIGLRELQLGARPVFRSLPHSDKVSYPDRDYYNFDFRKTRTANWTMSRARVVAYWILVRATGGAIDRFKQPVALEWPQLMLMGVVMGTALLANAILWLQGQ